MLNFSFENQTRIHFGEGQISAVSKEIPKNAKVLVTYGGGSIKNNGVYEQVAEALQDHQWVEFSGIEPNPRVRIRLMKAQALIKAHDIDYLLAVGGGSVVSTGQNLLPPPRCLPAMIPGISLPSSNRLQPHYPLVWY